VDHQVLRAPLSLVLLIVRAMGRKVVREARSFNDFGRSYRIDVEPSAYAVQGIKMVAAVPSHDAEITLDARGDGFHDRNDPRDGIAHLEPVS